MGPVLAHNVPYLKKFKTPLDFGKTFRGKRIFGDHKTIRGIVAGMVMGLVTSGIQMLLVQQFSWLSDYNLGVVDYSSPDTLFMGLILGFGAVAGDALKSFFKRQLNIEPGKSWVPFDQIDFFVGGVLASLLFFTLPARLYFIGFFIALVLHPTVNFLSWLLRFQEKPY